MELIRPPQNYIQKMQQIRNPFLSKPFFLGLRKEMFAILKTQENPRDSKSNKKRRRRFTLAKV